jgi:hypothetical protein
MTTFDQILPIIRDVLRDHEASLPLLGPIIINRDLNGRTRLVLAEKVACQDTCKAVLTDIIQTLVGRLGPHALPPENMVLYEPDPMAVIAGAPHFILPGFSQVEVVDRLVSQSGWADIRPVTPGAPRIVFFSIKGGVGRSTALAATAWSLAQAGKRVLVLDLDLESPGLSSSLLPTERRPMYGITDWLVEDLVDNGAAVMDEMVVTSDLSHDGEIYVVPAHGRDPGEYVAKLGRAWMAKSSQSGVPESWSGRLQRLLGDLEQRWQPDIILLDSRAGIDEAASACLTDLGAQSVLLFALDADQTWAGYRILFQHWHRTGVVRTIRERLQVVGAMIPEVESTAYFTGLLERSWDLFTEELYDEIPAGETTDERFSFAVVDEPAPHYPWAIRWHRGFAALRSLHSPLQQIDPGTMMAVFGPLIQGVRTIIAGEDENV